MTIENDFLPFATGTLANVLTQSEYVAETSLIQNGFVAGIVPSIQVNKVWRQSSIMAAVIASFIVAETGQTAIDDGTTTTLLANFTAAVNAASKNKIVLTDTGTANAYAAANPVPLTALPTATGFTQTVKIAHLNTGTSTYAPDGLATAPIYSLAGALLQGNELPVNGVATLVSFVDPLLNSGNLCWVLYECVGGAQPVAPATASQHAMQLGQATGRVLNVRTFTSSTTYTPTTGTNSVDVLVIGGGGAGGSTSTTSTGQISVASGGTAGAAARSYLASGFSGQAITIGAGGTATGTATGGASSFGSLITCSGAGAGGNGIAAAPIYLTTAGVSVSSASGGNIFNAPGSVGSPGYALATASFLSGSGASSILGGGGAGKATSSAAGNNATSPGAGGGGALAGASSGVQTGGSGAAGIVIVTEYS